jgi:hypothetical protein
MEFFEDNETSVVLGAYITLRSALQKLKKKGWRLGYVVTAREIERSRYLHDTLIGYDVSKMKHTKEASETTIENVQWVDRNEWEDELMEDEGSDSEQEEGRTMDNIVL